MNSSKNIRTLFLCFIGLASLSLVKLYWVDQLSAWLNIALWIMIAGTVIVALVSYIRFWRERLHYLSALRRYNLERFKMPPKELEE